MNDTSLCTDKTNGHIRNNSLFLVPDNPQSANKEKIEKISQHFRTIMEILGLDLTDDSLRDTPGRVAKMYVEENFRGLDPAAKPSMTLFENSYGYKGMLIEKNITLFSQCEHHFVPFTGRVHVAYFPSGKMIGLSKLNRLVQYLAARPQMQEKLTLEIAAEMQAVLSTPDVAVMIEATHFCVASRGVADVNSSLITTEFSGRFLETETRTEFLNQVRS